MREIDSDEKMTLLSATHQSHYLPVVPGKPILCDGKERAERDASIRFRVSPINQGQAEKLERVCAAGKELWLLIEDECPLSDDRCEAQKKVEEAIFWAVASIGRWSPLDGEKGATHEIMER